MRGIAVVSPGGSDVHVRPRDVANAANRFASTTDNYANSGTRQQ